MQYSFMVTMHVQIIWYVKIGTIQFHQRVIIPITRENIFIYITIQK